MSCCIGWDHGWPSSWGRRRQRPSCDGSTPTISPILLIKHWQSWAKPSRRSAYKLFGIRSDAKYSQITWIMWTSTDRREGVFHIICEYLSSLDLRYEVNEGLNVVERWNGSRTRWLRLMFQDPS